MQFRFIGNACGVFHGSQGTKILCDPWLVDGVFEGSWCHYPPIVTKPSDVQGVDALYISHLHPDHFDERYFEWRKDIPILVLDHEPNFLPKILEKRGYTNLVRIKDGETIRFREFEATMFAPFAKHCFHEAAVGNLIDSALLLQDGTSSALNCNDNTPTPEACQAIRERFGRITMAMINYNAAGPYPACFTNLSEAEKLSEHERILDRNFEYMAELANALNPEFLLPFAGAYVLGGRLCDLNQYLGTTTWDECAAFVDPLLTETVSICMREGDVFDLTKGAPNKPYVPIDREHMSSYIETLRSMKYPYESDPEPDGQKLISDVVAAKTKMRQRMEMYGLKPQMGAVLVFNFVRSTLWPGSGGILGCRMDNRLLRRILDRKASWNNAEIGAHIEFFRKPNTYDVDLHTSLQLFHL